MSLPQCTVCGFWHATDIECPVTLYEREQEQNVEDCRGFDIEGCNCGAFIHCWSCAESVVGDESVLAKAARERTTVEVHAEDALLKVSPRYTADCVDLCCGGCYDPLVEDEPDHEPDPEDDYEGGDDFDPYSGCEVFDRNEGGDDGGW